jgi:hypothetical protein
MDFMSVSSWDTYRCKQSDETKGEGRHGGGREGGRREAHSDHDVARVEEVGGVVGSRGDEGEVHGEEEAVELGLAVPDRPRDQSGGGLC